MNVLELDEKGHPRVKPGYVRVYEDHTGRWYHDYTQTEYDAFSDDPLMEMLKEAIQEEIDKEILERLRG